MKLNGTHKINSSNQYIWELLMDPHVLVRITPGIKDLKSVAPNTYKAISEIKIGPVKGSFEGLLELKNIIKHREFTMVVNKKSKIGNVNAVCKIELIPDGDETDIQFNGEAKLSGLLARTGQRVLSGVAKSITNQFFEDLEKEINNYKKDH